MITYRRKTAWDKLRATVDEDGRQRLERPPIFECANCHLGTNKVSDAGYCPACEKAYQYGVMEGNDLRYRTLVPTLEHYAHDLASEIKMVLPARCERHVEEALYKFIYRLQTNYSELRL